jgi:hypothetical protein
MPILPFWVPVAMKQHSSRYPYALFRTYASTPWRKPETSNPQTQLLDMRGGLVIASTSSPAVYIDPCLETANDSCSVVW